MEEENKETINKEEEQEKARKQAQTNAKIKFNRKNNIESLKFKQRYAFTLAGKTKKG